MSLIHYRNLLFPSFPCFNASIILVFAFSTVIYLINWIPTPILNLMSPYHKLFGVPPNYSKLLSFGCLCYPWLRPYFANKLSLFSSSCVFIGYSPTQSAYLCLDLSSSRVYTFHHVKFVESVFPFTIHQPHPNLLSHITPSHWTSISHQTLHPLWSHFLTHHQCHNPASSPWRPTLNLAAPSHCLSTCQLASWL